MINGDKPMRDKIKTTVEKYKKLTPTKKAVVVAGAVSALAVLGVVGVAAHQYLKEKMRKDDEKKDKGR